MNTKFLSALTAVIVSLPLLASAVATGTPAQGAQTSAGSSTKLVTVATCPAAGKTIKPGASGADVASLQIFLAKDKTVYPEGLVSGKYDAPTMKAVQRFQAKNGIASSGTPDTTGYGAVGPRTAAVIAQKCSGSAVSAPPPNSNTGSCLALTRSLKRGATGADVSSLQQFLAQDKGVYPEGTDNGTYGPLTEKAVQRFQAKNGIASSGTPDTTGYGAVGPKTMATLNASCSGGLGATNAVGGFISVTPLSGGSARSIAVQVTVNSANSCDAATYAIDYGDGTGKSPFSIPKGGCKPMTNTVNHTYQLAGTYQVTLSSGTHKTSVAVAVN